MLPRAALPTLAARNSQLVFHSADMCTLRDCPKHRQGLHCWELKFGCGSHSYCSSFCPAGRDKAEHHPHQL